ncbi:MAG: hypothetical protein J5985_09610 [Kiritimatiellae bacterium]|nr:hypothetical protein [Kiritimatiellia bacterium]
MKRLTACLVLAAAFVSASPPELARLSDVYRRELVKIAEEFNRETAALAEDYVIELRNLSKRMKDRQDAAGFQVVRQEASRYMKALAAEPDPFESVPELTPEDLAKTSEALKIVQRAYIDTRTAKIRARDGQVEELAKKLLGGLDALRSKAQSGGRGEDAAAFKKEANRIRVAMQRKDFAFRALKEAGGVCAAMPPPPDVSKIKDRASRFSQGQGKGNLATGDLTTLPPAVQSFLLKPLEYDKSWPPEIVNWRYEGTGPYSHDDHLYNLPGIPAELGIFAHPKNMKAYVRGVKRMASEPRGNRMLAWTGRAVSWRLKDSRDLVCSILFRTMRPALNESGGPAGCVAVYDVESNKLLASYTVPMLSKETELYVAKHYSYNRLTIKWVGSKKKRGFTLPDHTPLRVVVGVVGYAKGEEIDATIEILPARQNEDR